MERLKGISSMATRLVLAELAEKYQRQSGGSVEIESVGGVDAAKRVQAGEAFDVVILASDAIDKLIASGHALADTKIDIARSGVAVAVKRGMPAPDISSEEALRRAVLQARTISYSTGPSGTALAKLFLKWGIADEIKSKIVQPEPGIPVGTLVANGEVELGFQQLSEMIHVNGISIVGPMPPEIQIITTFSGAVCGSSKAPDRALAFLDFLASSDAIEAKARQGMESA